jgi:hypothetical protein
MKQNGKTERPCEIRSCFSYSEVNLKKNNSEVRFAENMVKGQIMVIYIDIFGNEKREVKNLKDFTKKTVS